jgi:putative ABC transport system permease protein
MRQGLAFGIVGVVLGIVGGMALTRYLEKMLFGVTAADPVTFVVVAVVFISVTLVASYVPAQRATRVDPLAALRYE